VIATALDDVQGPLALHSTPSAVIPTSRSHSEAAGFRGPDASPLADAAVGDESALGRVAEAKGRGETALIGFLPITGMPEIESDGATVRDERRFDEFDWPLGDDLPGFEPERTLFVGAAPTLVEEEQVLDALSLTSLDSYFADSAPFAGDVFAG
jgi:hypothetical protein